MKIKSFLKKHSRKKLKKSIKESSYVKIKSLTTLENGKNSNIYETTTKKEIKTIK